MICATAFEAVASLVPSAGVAPLAAEASDPPVTQAAVSSLPAAVTVKFLLRITWNHDL